MQKSKIFFQIFIWTFLVNIREAKPTSQNSERMQRRAITGQIPDLYGPIADIPPTFSSAIGVRTWCRQFMEPLFKSEPQKLNAKVHRTLNSDCSLVGVLELDRANSSDESFWTVRTLKSSSTVRTANAKNFHGLVELFAGSGSFENFWCLLLEPFELFNRF